MTLPMTGGTQVTITIMKQMRNWEDEYAYEDDYDIDAELEILLASYDEESMFENTDTYFGMLLINLVVLNGLITRVLKHR